MSIRASPRPPPPRARRHGGPEPGGAASARAPRGRGPHVGCQPPCARPVGVRLAALAAATTRRRSAPGCRTRPGRRPPGPRSGAPATFLTGRPVPSPTPRGPRVPPRTGRRRPPARRPASRHGRHALGKSPDPRQGGPGSAIRVTSSARHTAHRSDVGEFCVATLTPRLRAVDHSSRQSRPAPSRPSWPGPTHREC